MTKDLYVLAADVDMCAAMEALLGKRQPSLGIDRVTFTIGRHLQRDPGCRLRAAKWLQAFIHDHAYALVLFDRHGSGQDDLGRRQIQQAVESDLNGAGWEGRCKAIVIDPELEAWMWTASPHTARLLGWESEGNDGLRAWLHGQDCWPDGATKPPDPKSALHMAMRRKSLRPTARVFESMARRVGLRRCQDPAFVELRQTLQAWFPRS